MNFSQIIQEHIGSVAVICGSLQGIISRTFEGVASFLILQCVVAPLISKLNYETYGKFCRHFPFLDSDGLQYIYLTDLRMQFVTNITEILL